MTTPNPEPGHGSHLCGRPLSKGKPGTCKRPAGWGTDHVGVGSCKLHLGKTESHTKAAHVEQARRDVALFRARRDIHPAEALLELVQWTAGEVDYWRARVAELDEEDLTWGTTKVKTGGDDAGVTEEAKPNVAYVMLTDASNRLDRYSSSALKAGVDAALVRIAQSQGAQLIAVIEQHEVAKRGWVLHTGQRAIDGGWSIERLMAELDEQWQPHTASVMPALLRAVDGGATS